MTDTVTVPRWALEFVIDSAIPPKLLAPRAKLQKWAGAMTALKCALDAKTEIPITVDDSGGPSQLLVRIGNQEFCVDGRVTPTQSG